MPVVIQFWVIIVGVPQGRPSIGGYCMPLRDADVVAAGIGDPKVPDSPCLESNIGRVQPQALEPCVLLFEILGGVQNNLNSNRWVPKLR